MDQRAATAVTAFVIGGSILLASPFLLFGGLVMFALIGWLGVILMLAMVGGIYWVFGSAFQTVLRSRAR